MRIAIGAGHSPNCDGARAYGYSENHEARLVCDAFEEICARMGTPCVRCDSEAKSQAGYLNEQVAKFNAAACNVSLQIHLNAGGGTGCEVWYKNASYLLAATMATNMSRVLGLRDRGAKYSANLRILNDVRYKPYIVEVCFIDTWSDISALQGKHEAVAAALYKAVTGVEPEDDMQLSDKLNDELLPDGSYNNVANVLNWTRINSDEILARLEDGGIEIDYDKLADKVAERIGDDVAQKVADLFAARLKE